MRQRANNIFLKAFLNKCIQSESKKYIQKMDKVKMLPGME